MTAEKTLIARVDQMCSNRNSSSSGPSSASWCAISLSPNHRSTDLGNVYTGAPTQLSRTLRARHTHRWTTEGAERISQVLIAAEFPTSRDRSLCRNVVPLQGLPMITTGPRTVCSRYPQRSSSSSVSPPQVIDSSRGQTV